MKEGKQSKKGEASVKEKRCVECEYCQVGAEPYGKSHYVCTHSGKNIDSDVAKLEACAAFKVPRPRPA